MTAFEYLTDRARRVMQRWLTFRYWLFVLWEYGRGNPFAAMCALKRERDDFLHELQGIRFCDDDRINIRAALDRSAA